VYLHGLIRDAKGKKMSKSKGNVISPLEISEVYGTDALRMGLIVNNAPGTDMNLDPKKIEAYKKFANKIWNATRFVLQNTEGITPGKLTPEDTLILEEWKTKQKEIAGDIENFRLHLASEKLYHFFWKRFADEIIEQKKPLLGEKTSQDAESSATLLLELLKGQLTSLHPFMPFITEEVWRLLGEKELLIVTPWK
jgi:valyl-tRNA synthetase